ncbi:hypothetical protein FIBSPDRAFT_881081 [Athelia psychrophila]|uniref:Uncharacterized protein n=1 Tax=Athelia psychrophila TaxID=1759441 RepID=A0A166X9Q9_9AGAM|nr:hypothetical protein FIBSPDRAFT_881081 [Fibularhizoctonia sp. CBS 109695]
MQSIFDIHFSSLYTKTLEALEQALKDSENQGQHMCGVADRYNSQGHWAVGEPIQHYFATSNVFHSWYRFVARFCVIEDYLSMHDCKKGTKEVVRLMSLKPLLYGLRETHSQPWSSPGDRTLARVMSTLVYASGHPLLHMFCPIEGLGEAHVAISVVLVHSISQPHGSLKKGGLTVEQTDRGRVGGMHHWAVEAVSPLERGGGLPPEAERRSCSAVAVRLGCAQKWQGRMWQEDTGADAEGLVGGCGAHMWSSRSRPADQE